MNPRIVLAFASLFAVSLAARAADYSVTLTQVQLCCNSCVKDANQAVSPVTGATTQVDKAAHSITISASDRATAQKAVDALVAAGYYGQPSDPAITLAQTSAPAGEVNSLKVSGVHLCCKKCVNAVNDAVTKVKGVTGTTASKDAESFEITGNFNAQDVINALHQSGFSARVN